SEETGSTAGGSPGGETSTRGEDEPSATASASETTQTPGGESPGTGGGTGGEKDKPSGTGGGDEKTDEPSTEKTAEKSVLNINSMPAARVEIDGKDTGKYTPVLNYEVEPGSHRIRLINEEIGFEKTYSVELKPGESKKIIHRK
ncbi:MAG: PEGA domain-containing protein, partial [Bradymonadaceae bacterium]